MFFEYFTQDIPKVFIKYMRKMFDTNINRLNFQKIN